MEHTTKKGRHRASREGTRQHRRLLHCRSCREARNASAHAAPPLHPKQRHVTARSLPFHGPPPPRRRQRPVRTAAWLPAGAIRRQPPPGHRRPPHPQSSAERTRAAERRRRCRQACAHQAAGGGGGRRRRRGTVPAPPGQLRVAAAGGQRGGPPHRGRRHEGQERPRRGRHLLQATPVAAAGEAPGREGRTRLWRRWVACGRRRRRRDRRCSPAPRGAQCRACVPVPRRVHTCAACVGTACALLPSRLLHKPRGVYTRTARGAVTGGGGGGCVRCRTLPRAPSHCVRCTAARRGRFCAASAAHVSHAVAVEPEDAEGETRGGEASYDALLVTRFTASLPPPFPNFLPHPHHTPFFFSFIYPDYPHTHTHISCFFCGLLPHLLRR